MSMPFSSNSELPSGRSSFWHLRSRFAFSFNLTPQCHSSHSEPNNAIWKRLKHSHNSTILSRNSTQLTQLNASYATHTTEHNSNTTLNAPHTTKHNICDAQKGLHFARGAIVVQVWVLNITTGTSHICSKDKEIQNITWFLLHMCDSLLIAPFHIYMCSWTALCLACHTCLLCPWPILPLESECKVKRGGLIWFDGPKHWSTLSVIHS